ncbi:MAG: hypothetical protein HC767_01070 [Akkermansiaceae bacterium]|nr:hypothetical protein [Akkermansiaceae bacterium]
MQIEEAARATEADEHVTEGGALERLQEVRVVLELRLACVEDRWPVEERATEQQIAVRSIREDIDWVEREAEALQNQVWCTSNFHTGPPGYSFDSNVERVIVETLDTQNGTIQDMHTLNPSQPNESMTVAGA